MNKKVLLAGILLYLLIIPFFYHSDIKEIYFKSQFLSNGVFNIYSHIASNPEAQLFGQFNYQPLAYFLFGILYIPIKLLAGADFPNWLAMGNNAVETPHLMRYLFLMKLPLIVAFSLTGVYLSKLFEDKKKSNLTLFLWFFNPMSIYVVGLIGQFDIVPVLLSVMALYYAKRKPYLSAILLGLGTALKGFPLFLLPFLVICIEGSFWKRTKVFLTGLVTAFIFIIPFIGDKAFFEAVALSGLTQRMFIPGIPFGFDEKFMIVPGLFLVSLFLAIKYDFGKVKNLYKYFFASMFIISTAVHFHAQWALWYLPLLLIILVKKDNFKKPLYIVASVTLLISYFGYIFLLKDRFLTVGLLSVFDPAVFYLPSPFELVGKFYDPYVLQSIFHTFCLISGLAIAIDIILKSKHDRHPERM